LFFVVYAESVFALKNFANIYETCVNDSGSVLCLVSQQVQSPILINRINAVSKQVLLINFQTFYNMFFICQSRSRTESNAKYITSKLNLVDLAGSERIGKTGVIFSFVSFHIRLVSLTRSFCQVLLLLWPQYGGRRQECSCRTFPASRAILNSDIGETMLKISKLPSDCRL